LSINAGCGGVGWEHWPCSSCLVLIQWPRQTCLCMRTRIGCHSSRWEWGRHQCRAREWIVDEREEDGSVTQKLMDEMCQEAGKSLGGLGGHLGVMQAI
jgi:hypothetical protein